jgi:hypothetical protein
MTDSSLTTPLPHLKSLYYTHMDGLAVSGSHGEERVPQLNKVPTITHLTNAMLVSDCTLSNPLKF